VGLRFASVTPPEDPLLFHWRTHVRAFSPFTKRKDGWVAIRPEWRNPGDELRGIVGSRHGRDFLYPSFRPARFTREKPPGTIRIFALGGSTTFGLYAGAESAFPAAMARRLQALWPARGVEVINLGCPGWASDRVANVLPAVLALDPDLLVVYTGHNEMLAGHVGMGSGLGFAARLRARLLSLSTTFAWFNHVVASTLRPGETALLREEAAATKAGAILAYEPRRVLTSDRVLPGQDFYRRAERDFAQSLRSLIAAARERGVPILLVLPVANLLSPPSLSAHGPGFDQPRAFRSSMEEAIELRRQGRVDEARLRLERATALSPRHARAHYELGRLQLEAGKRAEALEALQRANDLDVRTHRITAELESTLIEVADDEGVDWIDLRPAFRADLDVETARNLFLDHLHPTPRGHAVIADALMPLLVTRLGSRAESE
jgi:lysophospholipase L1-like esterase